MSTRRKRPAPQKSAETPTSRAPKRKRRQGGKGKPFVKGQPDLPLGKRFQPGQSGNPGGRPRALKELKERIQVRGDDLIDFLFEIAEGLPEREGRTIVGPSHADRYHVIKELLDRGYGRTVQAIELSGPGGGAVETRDITQMNSSERRARLNELMAKAGAGAVDEAAAEPEGGEDDGSGSAG